MAVKIFAKAARRAPARTGRGERPREAGHNAFFISHPRFSQPGGITACMRSAVVAALCIMLLACAGIGAAPHIGKTARPDNRIPVANLPGGENTWAAKDLKIHYRAATAGEQFEISGFVEFNSNLAKYPMVNSFRVYLHFLDAEGMVLDSKLLWTAGGHRETRFVRWTFERQWPSPPGAVAVGFSYRGGASEAGGDSKFGSAKTGWDVYQAP